MTDRAIIDQANQLQKLYMAAEQYRDERNKDVKDPIERERNVMAAARNYQKEADKYIKVAVKNKISPHCTFTILTSIRKEVLHEQSNINGSSN